MFAHRIGRHLSKRPLNACGTASFASNVPREDRDFAVTLNGGGSLVGVIDGHCGSRVAEIVCKDLPKMIQAKLEASKAGDLKEEVLKQSYLELDAEILSYATTVQHSLVQEGACVLSAVVGDLDITVANAGDCGALLVKRDATWKWLNNFHNAGNPEEQARLKSAHPDESDVFECVRSRPINSPLGDRLPSVCYTKGMLQPTRAIGDWYLKELRFKPTNVRNFHPPYLSAEPEIVHTRRSSDMAYLVLATDGLWEILGASEVANLLIQNADQDQHTLARLLLDECLTRAGQAVGMSAEKLKTKSHTVSARNIVDDLTISVVDLNNKQ